MGDAHQGAARVAASPPAPKARTAIFEYSEGFYNPRRRHPSLGQLSPAEFERRAAENAKRAAAEPVTA